MKEKLTKKYSRLPRKQLEVVLDSAETKLTGFLDESTKIFMENFGKASLSIKMKSYNDFATQADMQIELLLHTWVATHFPNYNVYGEEYGNKTDKLSDWLWAIDPIDGTTNYKNGNPECAIVISLRYKDFPILSVARFPVKNEEYRARIFSGATLNGRILVPSPETNLKTSLVSMNYLNHPERMIAMMGKLWDEVGGIHMKMCSLAEACDVISGKLQAALLYELGPHEWPAIYLLAKESGCEIEPMTKPGSEFSIEGLENRSFVIAANDQIMKSINSLIGLPPKLDY